MRTCSKRYKIALLSAMCWGAGSKMLWCESSLITYLLPVRVAVDISTCRGCSCIPRLQPCEYEDAEAYGNGRGDQPFGVPPHPCLASSGCQRSLFLPLGVVRVLCEKLRVKTVVVCGCDLQQVSYHEPNNNNKKTFFFLVDLLET